MIRLLAILITAAALAPAASAQTMFRCDEGGKTVYQDRPCLGGTERRMTASGGQTAEDIGRARMRDRQRSDEQERARIAAAKAPPPADAKRQAAAPPKPNAAAN
jgi:hypothetical protein